MPGRFYVTTPIYYVNDAPHIGHAYTTVTADAVARWHRLLGEDTLFLTGTDEHGLKVQRAAEEHGQTPQAWADQTTARFAEAWELLDVSNDDYIRTTEPRHHRAVQELLTRIKDNGWIYQDTYAGWYCVGCEAYYAESDLDEGNQCPIHGRPVEWFEEENWFFKLSAFEGRLTEWLSQDPSPVKPDGKRNEALGIVRQGLEDVSISRSSIDWGVPVPWDPDHVFYVWYDALINYATAAGFGSDEAAFERWWPEVHHLIGKDIIRFHCVYWPAMLMAADLAPPKSVHVHGFLLVGGEKMSKTKLNQITPAELVEDFGVDGFRHHFLHDQPFGPDGDFSYEGMVARYNADLANNLGNLLSRVATVVDKKCGGIGPAPDPDSPLAPVAAEAYAETAAAWDRVQPSVALDATWRLIRETNAHLEVNEPWKMEPGAEVERIMGDALEALRIVTVLASPAAPASCREIWRRIGLPGTPEEQRLPDAATWGQYPGGLPVEKGAPLFPRMKG
jgi:methionyl-tRNA synthetase